MEDRKKYSLSTDELQGFIPHRPPFLMIDQIEDIFPAGEPGNFDGASTPGTRVVARKTLSSNEPYLAGHFPGFAIMPGVLIIEAMAQTSCFSIYPFVKDVKGFAESFESILVGVNNTRFRLPVFPGMTLQVETVVKKVRGKLWIFDCNASVDGKKVAEAELMANLNPYGRKKGGPS